MLVDLPLRKSESFYFPATIFNYLVQLFGGSQIPSEQGPLGINRYGYYNSFVDWFGVKWNTVAQPSAKTLCPSLFGNGAWSYQSRKPNYEVYTLILQV